MLNLFLSTLAMMALTFVIGFLVAGVIKLIAVSADSLDFYSSHQVELQRLRKWRKMRSKLNELLSNGVPPEYMGSFGDKRGTWSRGVNTDLEGMKQSGYYHGVSHGASDMDLLDYYYPDTKTMYLDKREEMITSHNAHNKKSSPNKKQH